jgi:hypothetical protein
MNKTISILGVHADLVQIPRNELKGLNADILLRFFYYKTTFNNQGLCVIQAKKDAGYTPLKYKRISEQIEKTVDMPVVFLLNPLSYYERARLIAQGVFFIISDKYAFLPSLIVNIKAKSKSKIPVKLTPAAQYLLFYYLLTDTTETFTIRDFEKMIPYNYLAISRAVINLEECKLCRTEKDDTGTKNIRFEYSKRELFGKAQNFLSSPIKKILYSDTLPEKHCNISGVNALSLKPKESGTIAIWDRFFNASDIQFNEIEGIYKIEIWKYPTSIPYQPDNGIVDKLSLHLLMKNDPEPPIEKELKINDKKNKMKIQYASDLHLEFSYNYSYLQKNPLIPAGDILILAGDIACLNDDNYRNHPFWDWVSDNFKQTIVAVGDHELYKYYDLAKMPQGLVYSIRKNVKCYYNDVVSIDNVDFIISTLWAKIQLEDAYPIKQGLTDFNQILNDGEPLTFTELNKEHGRCLAFIKEKVGQSRAEHIIVVSHHVPSFQLVSPDFKKNRTNGIFAGELDKFIETSPIKYWIYGHSHCNIDKMIGKTRCLSNQLGYVFHNEHLSFNQEKIIEV